MSASASALVSASAVPAPLAAVPHARWITDWPATAELRARWSALATDPFGSWEWFDAAWAWAGREAQLRLLAVFEGERLAGVLPACVSTAQGRRTLRLITVPDTQFADLLVAAPAQAPAVAACMAEALVAARGEWDALEFTHLRPGGAWCALRSALAARCTVDEAPFVRNLHIALDQPWAPYYAGLSKTVREKNKLAANRLARVGGLEVEWLRTSTPELLEAITQISAASWKRETGLSLDQPGPQAWCARLAQLAAERGWLSVWIGRLNGAPVAMELQLISDGTVYALRSDFVAEHAQVSPGTYLNWKLLERLFGEGLTSYYMGPGENAYKLRWTRSGAELMQLRAWSPTLRGRALHLWDTRLKPAARTLRDRLRPAKAAPEDTP
ncbi:MAG TPA: GNAT family N-acetyltransferase [Burkholderiaceae bacterium]|nr:GNAT family N-acetyltransferase [Burkholderiaceae bacterium]